MSINDIVNNNERLIEFINFIRSTISESNKKPASGSSISSLTANSSNNSVYYFVQSKRPDSITLGEELVTQTLNEANDKTKTVTIKLADLQPYYESFLEQQEAKKLQQELLAEIQKAHEGVEKQFAKRQYLSQSYLASESMGQVGNMWRGEFRTEYKEVSKNEEQKRAVWNNQSDADLNRLMDGFDKIPKDSYFFGRKEDHLKNKENEIKNIQQFMKDRQEKFNDPDAVAKYLTKFIQKAPLGLLPSILKLNFSTELKNKIKENRSNIEIVANGNNFQVNLNKDYGQEVEKLISINNLTDEEKLNFKDLALYEFIEENRNSFNEDLKNEIENEKKLAERVPREHIDEKIKRAVKEIIESENKKQSNVDETLLDKENQAQESAENDTNQPSLRLYTDFDGTGTGMNGEEVLQPIIGDGPGNNRQGKGYAWFRTLMTNTDTFNPVFKEDMVKIIREKFPREMKLCDHFKEYLEAMVKQNAEVFIMTRNSEKYVRAHLEAAGMDSGIIDKIKIYAVGNQYYAKGMMVSSIEREKNDNVPCQVYDDSLRDGNSMVKAIKAINSNKEVTFENAAMGQFQWKQKYEAIHAPSQDKTTRHAENISSQPVNKQSSDAKGDADAIKQIKDKIHKSMFELGHTVDALKTYESKSKENVLSEGLRNCSYNNLLMQYGDQIKKGQNLSEIQKTMGDLLDNIDHIKIVLYQNTRHLGHLVQDKWDAYKNPSPTDRNPTTLKDVMYAIAEKKEDEKQKLEFIKRDKMDPLDFNTRISNILAHGKNSVHGEKQVAAKQVREAYQEYCMAKYDPNVSVNKLRELRNEVVNQAKQYGEKSKEVSKNANRFNIFAKGGEAGKQVRDLLKSEKRINKEETEKEKQIEGRKGKHP